MYRNLVRCSPEHAATLPARCRALVRYRREAFGYLVAFPAGRVAMFDESVAPLLVRGATFDECRPHLLRNLQVPTDFHFSAPLLAWLEITRRCNLRCEHCFVEGGEARNGEMSTARIMRLLDELAELGVFSVVISGGEPTIHSDFVAIVRRAHELGFTVSIATNGMALREKLLSQLPTDDLIISMSLDGAHGQGGPGVSDFDYVTQRIVEVRDRGFNTSIMTTTTHDNVRELNRIIHWAIDHDVSLRSVPFVPSGRGAHHRTLINTAADVELAARFWLDEEMWERVRDPKLGLCTGKVFNFLLTMVFATRRCMSGRGLCYITSAGDVYPCTTCSGAKVLCGGNVQMRSFADVWESPWEIRGLTWKNFEKTCEGCPINDEKYFCTGRCPGSSSVHGGRLDGCGMTPFLIKSVLRRETLFRENVRAEPRVEVSPTNSITTTTEEIS
ncbi:MAG: radical SAM protein [Deltaproteobacteria bacterium]|nr:radical SAM protein [Deltaproteobacteria bacterium]